MSYIKNKVIERLDEVFRDEPYHLVCIALTGSHAYGIATPKSDKDIMAVFLPPLSYLLGVKQTEQVMFEKSLGFEGVAYSFNKWYNQMINQNPNIIELLWHEEHQYIYRDDVYWNMLVSERDNLLSKKIKHTYCGYAYAQLQRLKILNKNANSNESRLQNIEKFGYDTKAASHVFRLLGTGLEGLVEHRLNVLRPDNHFLLAIREGKYTYEQLLEMANKKIELIDEAYIRSTLRNSIDSKLAQKLNLDIITKIAKQFLKNSE